MSSLSCIDASTLFSMLASPLLLLFLTYLSELFPSPFKKWCRVSHKGDSRSIYPFDEIPAAKLGFQKYSRSSKIRTF